MSNCNGTNRRVSQSHSGASDERRVAARPARWHPLSESFDLRGTPASAAYSRIRILRGLGLGLLLGLFGISHAREPALAEAQGMGGATRANLGDTGGIYTAPATMMLRGRYDVALGGRLGPSGNRLYQLAAMDSKTGPVGLGICWFRTQGNPVPESADLPGWRKLGDEFDNPTRSSVFNASLAGSNQMRTFGVGAGVRYFSVRSPVTGDDDAWNMSASLAGLIQDQLVLSLTVENPIPSDMAGTPMLIGTGTRWAPISAFNIGGDLVLDVTSQEGKVGFGYLGGAEVVLASVIPIRAGYLHDVLEQESAVTFGLGAISDVMGFHYAVQLVLPDDGTDLDHRHALSMRVSL